MHFITAISTLKFLIWKLFNSQAPSLCISQELEKLSELQKKISETPPSPGKANHTWQQQLSQAE